MIAFLLLACTTSPAPAEPTPEPQEKAAEPEEAPAEEGVMLVFGVQCEPMPEGLPDSPDAVKAKLEAEGVKVASVSAMPTCKACQKCPMLAVEVHAEGGVEAVKSVFPDNLAMP
ncbi:MAG: hypothetical protein H6737_05245 [Alphaproteobacteria bacterium]|nr:hypothetical protein [Alphaproteobacteria bacterium]